MLFRGTASAMEAAKGASRTDVPVTTRFRRLRRKINVWRRLTQAFVLALAVVAAASQASAVADPPLAFASPSAYTRERTPEIAGTTEDHLDAVKVELFKGEVFEAEPAEAPLETLEAKPSDAGEWSVTPEEPLKQGTYTARATQGAPLLGPEARTTFAVDLSKPAVTLASVPSPSTNLTPSFSGRAGTAAGDIPTITVTVYPGPAAAGSPAEVMRTTASGETWSTGPAPQLPEGEYTAVATQADLAGNVGESESVSYVLAPGQVPPTASLTWIPASPDVGEPVSLVSTSLGGSSAIVSYSWDPAGGGPFIPGGPVFTTTFTTPGAHVVRLLVADAHGNTGLARTTIHVSAAHRRLMQPFPIVRIVGNVTSRGAKIKLLSVQAPPGARVTVRCRGRTCGAKKLATRPVAVTRASVKTGMSLLTFARFERRLQAGTVLQIVVTRGNEVGKYTSFLIRRGRLPVRNDACIEPSNPRPQPCPTS
jgi:hypothetical protein